MSNETIEVEITDSGVGRIALNRPENANAFNLPLAKELAAAARAFDADPKVRAVVVTGRGRFFTAGGDLAEFTSAGDDVERFLQEMTLYIHQAVSHFHRMDAPVIMALNGTAAGGGFSLAISGDLVIASKKAKLTMGYHKIGLSPDATSTYFLPRLVGLRRAQELMLTDRVLTADEALEWGLVTRVVEPEALETEVTALAEHLAAGATLAFGGTKRLLHTTFGNGLETQAQLESRSVAALAMTRDSKEGMAAFLEKRPAKFEGK